jgi:hypothetical protein
LAVCNEAPILSDEIEDLAALGLQLVESVGQVGVLPLHKGVPRLLLRHVLAQLRLGCAMPLSQGVVRVLQIGMGTLKRQKLRAQARRAGRGRVCHMDKLHNLPQNRLVQGIVTCNDFVYVSTSPRGRNTNTTAALLEDLDQRQTQSFDVPLTAACQNGFIPDAHREHYLSNENITNSAQSSWLGYGSTNAKLADAVRRR